MPALRVGELLEACGGALLAGDPQARITSYSIDTRKLEPGGAFFALIGERADGHAFVPDAARRGAALAVVSRPPAGEAPAPSAVIQVDDVAAALARCGAYARQRIRGTVVALTGSAGKTTTKEYIAAGLGASLRVHRTTASLNNELGVPLTLLGCPEDAEAVVIEEAMRGPGEIAFLTRIVNPDVGLITNVRPVHLEFFESVDGIAAAKGELYAVMRDDAVAVVNLDDERSRLQAARHAGPRVTFGRHEGADLRLEAIQDRFVPGAGLSFRHEGRLHEVPLAIGGAHAALDALAAAAAVAACGAALEPALAAMSRLEPAPGRGRITETGAGVTVVDDSYNSNPEALASILGTLGASEPRGRRVLVMGDMLELGPQSASFHQMAGELAARHKVALLVAVGPLSRHAADVARSRGLEVHAFDAADAAAARVPALVGDGDLVVVKGSRGVHLEHVVSALVSRRGEAA